MLEIKNLTIRYGHRVIIDNQNISFRRGEITGIKGKSGAGKSSLLNVLGLIRVPNKECQYWYDGQQIDVFDEENNSMFRMNHIGFVFQQGNLMKNLTAIENVMLPQMMCETDEKKILETAAEWIHFVDLETIKNSYPEDLSGGEEQRIAIARALINECDIILADEPTASLDAENSRRIMKMLERLAKELNKIVVVVSHDEETIGYSDVIYEIEERKLQLRERRSHAESASADGNRTDKRILKKKKLWSFIKNYENLRRTEYRLNRILIVISAVIVAIASLSFGFGDAFTRKQKEFLNSISDRSLLVIHDTLGLNASADYDDAVSFGQDAIEFIREIPNVEKGYPFYYFASYGMTVNKNEHAGITVLGQEGGVLAEIEYTNTYLADGNEFSISPLFEEENVNDFLLQGSTKQLGEDEVYLTYALAASIFKNPEELIGKKIVMDCFVPTKLYSSEATKPTSGTGPGDIVDAEKVEIDGNVSVLVKVEKTIGGVLNNSYRNDKYENNGNLMLMDYSEMMSIIEEHKQSLDVQAFPGFEEKPLAPSMLVVFATDYDVVKMVENKISNYDSAIAVINRSSDIEATRNNLEGIKYTMIVISLVLILVVAIMFSLLYYYKNRERKQEVGILKALGLSQRNVLTLIGVNMMKNAMQTFALSIVVSFVIKVVLNAMLGTEIISVSIGSVSLAFIISIVTVFASGMFSVWKTSKIDVIDAIRQNK